MAACAARGSGSLVLVFLSWSSHSALSFLLISVRVIGGPTPRVEFLSIGVIVVFECRRSSLSGALVGIIFIAIAAALTASRQRVIVFLHGRE
jgi:hypothetical protein